MVRPPSFQYKIHSIDDSIVAFALSIISGKQITKMLKIRWCREKKEEETRFLVQILATDMLA